MRLRWKLWTLRIILLSPPVVLILVLLAVLDGPLFPWSPVKLGYSRLTLMRADVYYPSEAALDPAYRDIDGMIAEAEDFHGLIMPNRITIIAARNWIDFHLQMPTVQGNAVGSATLQTGTVMWITPKLSEKHFDVAEFLRHELSHAILDQNMTLWHSFKMKQQEWFYEGLAVSFGRQTSYLTRDECVARARAEPLLPVFEGLPGDMRFSYPVWRYFVEFLKRTRGRAAFQDFMLAFMQDPKHWHGRFEQSFKIPFEQAVAEFESRIQEVGTQ